MNNNIMEELNKIKYRFVIDLTKFFVEKYSNGEIKDLELIIRNVKSLANFVKEMSFVYNEGIWFSDNPDTYKNLIEFNVQLYNEIEYLLFRLYINKGMNQEPIFIKNLMTWD